MLPRELFALITDVTVDISTVIVIIRELRFLSSMPMSLTTYSFSSALVIVVSSGNESVRAMMDGDKQTDYFWRCCPSCLPSIILMSNYLVIVCCH
jgi:hypothetical protein